jgi:sec-independent protein translocase protein TatA
MFEGLFQPMHLLIIFVIALLVFGPKKLPELGKGLGEAIQGFKESFKGGEEKPPANPNETKMLPDTQGPNGSPAEKPRDHPPAS